MKMKLMKKNKVIMVVLFIVASFLGLLVDKTISQAASGNISISTKESSYEKGASFTIEIKISSKDLIGDFEGFLTYDTNILEFVSEASFIAGGEGLIKISDINVSTGVESKKYVVKFRAKEVGNTVIAFRETASVYDFASGTAMSVSSNQLKIDVTTKALASDNGDLKELKVAPGILTPEYDPQITQYSVNVDADTNQLIISSIPSDVKASVSIEGNEVLKPGENTIVITVMAESGVKKSYKIIVVKKNNEKEDDINVIEDDLSNSEDDPFEYNSNDNTVTLSKPEIRNENNETYYLNEIKYQLLTPGSDIKIPEGYILTSMVIDNQTIEVYSLEGEPEHEFLLVYAKGPSGREGFYQFDKLESTLQRYESNGIISTGDIENNSNSKKEDESKLIIMGVILIVLTAVCILLTLSLVQSHNHNKRRKKK